MTGPLPKLYRQIESLRYEPIVIPSTTSKVWQHTTPLRYSIGATVVLWRTLYQQDVMITQRTSELVLKCEPIAWNKAKLFEIERSIRLQLKNPSKVKVMPAGCELYHTIFLYCSYALSTEPKSWPEISNEIKFPSYYQFQYPSLSSPSTLFSKITIRHYIPSSAHTRLN